MEMVQDSPGTLEPGIGHEGDMEMVLDSPGT